MELVTFLLSIFLLLAIRKEKIYIKTNIIKYFHLTFFNERLNVKTVSHINIHEHFWIYMSILMFSKNKNNVNWRNNGHKRYI